MSAGAGNTQACFCDAQATILWPIMMGRHRAALLVASQPLLARAAISLSYMLRADMQMPRQAVDEVFFSDRIRQLHCIIRYVGSIALEFISESRHCYSSIAFEPT